MKGKQQAVPLTEDVTEAALENAVLLHKLGGGTPTADEMEERATGSHDNVVLEKADPGVTASLAEATKADDHDKKFVHFGWVDYVKAQLHDMRGSAMEQYRKDGILALLREVVDKVEQAREFKTLAPGYQRLLLIWGIQEDWDLMQDAQHMHD